MFQFKEKIREAKNMGEVEERQVAWLWYPYIPFGSGYGTPWCSRFRKIHDCRQADGCVYKRETVGRV